MAFKGPERRLRTRFRIQLPLILKNADQEVRGVTRNLSLLGLSATTNGPLAAAQPIQCLLEVPQGSQPVVVNGTVIHCEPLPQPTAEGSYEVGIFFKGFEKNGESTLARHLEQISHKEETALKAGYRELRQRIAARRRRKRLEELRKQRRRLMRLRRRRRKLALARKRKAQKQKGRGKSKGRRPAGRRPVRKRR